MLLQKAVINIYLLFHIHLAVIYQLKHILKRPWLSIIKHLTKEKYNLESKEYRFFDEKENKYLRTQKYIFTKLI